MLPTRVKNLAKEIGEDYIREICRTKRRAAEVLEQLPRVGKKTSRLLVEAYSASTTNDANPTPIIPDLNWDDEYCMHQVTNFVAAQTRKDKKYSEMWSIALKRIRQRENQPWAGLCREMDILRGMHANENFQTRVLKRYARDLIERCMVAYPRTPSRASVEIFVSEEALCANPMAIFRRLQCPRFTEVDKVALDNKWWTEDSAVRCDEAILFKFETWVVNEQKCTAVDRSVLTDSVAVLIKQLEAFVHTRVDHMIDATRLVGYETPKGWLITTPTWSERCSIIYNFMSMQEREPDPPFNFADEEEEKDWRNQTRPMRDENGCASDAFLTWLIGRVAREVGLAHPPTQEQLGCVLTIVKNTRSILTAEAGTGKTDYGLRLSIRTLERLGYAVLVATPTHAAKRPIVDALGWDKKAIHTVKSLTYRPPWGAPPKLEGILAKVTQPLVVCLDEFGMCGTEDAADLFAILQRANVDVRVAMSGDHRQLPPVSPGCPFEDLIRFEFLPICSMTRVFRAETVDLAEFNRIYRPGHSSAKKWSFNPRDEHYILNHYPSVTHSATGSKEELIRTIERRVSKLVCECGCLESDLLLITNTNADCVEFSNTLRRIFRPGDEAERQNLGRSGKLPAFAPNDSVFFKTNTKWYKNGDDTIVRTASLYTVDVDIVLDQEDHELMLAIKTSRDTPDDDFWIKYREGLPQHFYCVRDQTWRITVEQDKLKPLSAVTFYKSQGVQFKRIVVALHSGWSITGRHLYTGGTRARLSLDLIGPRYAFDNEEVHAESCGRTTVLSALIDEHTDTMNEADEPSVLDASMRRTKSARIKKHIRARTWQRFWAGREWGECQCCRRPVSVWNFHVCHIAAHARGGDMSDDNLCVGCSTCNLKCGTRNFYDYMRLRRAQRWADITEEHGEKCVQLLMTTISPSVSTTPYVSGCPRIESIIQTTLGMTEEAIKSLFAQLRREGLIRTVTVPPRGFFTYERL